MKHVKSLALCLLALALVLALAGCGGGKSDLPGTYKIDLDLAPALNSAMTQLGLAEEDLADLTLPVPYTLTLGEDGTYSMQADKEATVTALHTYLQGCGSAIEAALYKTAEESGLSREDFDAAFEQSTGSSSTSARMRLRTKSSMAQSVWRSGPSAACAHSSSSASSVSMPPRKAMRGCVFGTRILPRRWVMCSGFSANDAPSGVR